MKPISAWAASRGYGTKVVPNEYTDLCDPGKRPSITITLDENTINSGEYVTATAEVNAPLGALKVDFYIDDVWTASDTTSPYSKALMPTSSGSRKITVKVTDRGYNTASDSDSVFVSGGEVSTDLNLSKSGDTFTLIYSGTGSLSYANLYLVTGDGTKTQRNMTETGAGWIWSGNSAGYTSAYCEAMTDFGLKLSNTISF
jgi:hypothetical protein